MSNFLARDLGFMTVPFAVGVAPCVPWLTGRVAIARYEATLQVDEDGALLSYHAPTDELADQTRRKSLEVHRQAVQLLGEQLRKLP